MAKVQPPIPIAARGLLRLLIVEDQPADVELTVAMLKRAGYSLSFDVVYSPTEFQQRLERNEYDIVLCDHNLGAWKGTDALDILQQSVQDIPFVVVTGTLGDEAAVEYIKHGAADYVLKHHLERLPVVLGRALQDKAHREEAARLQEVIMCGKREWELTFDSVPDAILLLDEQDIIRRANHAATDVLRLEFHQLIGKPCSEVLHGQHLKEIGLEQQAEIQEPQLGKIFDLSSTPLRDPRGALRGCVLVLRDITERRSLEEQFRQSQKMDAVGRLAGGVAHDFNNILTVIKGYSDLLLEELGSADERLHRAANEIYHSAERAASLTRQLLAFSRRQVLEPRVLDLNEVVASMDKMLQRLIGEDIGLVSICKSGLRRVKADPGQIEQVILNLAVNARDAMPQGGKLTIETANVELEEDYARIHMAVRPGSYVMLAVSDTGCGMDDETQAHIFEPFFTTKEKGTGLGLATTYGIVKQSGGNIWVYSELGQGTTIKIYLPRVRDAVDTIEPLQPVAARHSGSETILLVEDERAVRELVVSTLERYGYTVLAAGDAAEATQLAQQHERRIHLLLTDVVMPKVSGRQLVERLTPLRPEMKVLYMSGYTDDAIVRHGVLDPGTAFLQKPFNAADLTRRVLQVLNTGMRH